MTIKDMHRLYYAAALEAPGDSGAAIWMLAADSVILRMRAGIYRNRPDAEGEDGVSADACIGAAHVLMTLVRAMCHERLRMASEAPETPST